MRSRLCYYISPRHSASVAEPPSSSLFEGAKRRWLKEGDALFIAGEPRDEGLLLNRAAASRDDYDVLIDGVVVGRIFVSFVGPKDAPWFWCLHYGYYWDQTPTHGTAATREAAMAVAWRH